MPRARIPYDELQDLVEQKYPAPLFAEARIQVKDRNSIGIQAPTRVYDRSTGNFAPIGWKVTVLLQQFTGVRNIRGVYETTYEFRRFDDVLFTD